jgi:hypothetical protein
MPDTMTLISAITVGAGGASSIDFTSIPSTYNDLYLKFSLRATNSSSARAEDSLLLAINNNTTGTNYTSRYLRGNGSSVGSGTVTSGYSGCYIGEFNGSTSTANTFANGEMYIPDYLSSNNKSFSIDIVQETNGTTAYSHLMGNIWNQTSAITRLTFTDINSNTFAQYSSIYLYGIKKS